MLLTSIIVASTQETLKTAKKAYDAENFEKAYNLYLPLAKLGNVKAQSKVGNMLYFYTRNDKGFPYENEIKGVQWLQKASKKGDAEASYLLGTAYSRGSGGLKEDKKYAFELYIKSADAGYAESYYQLCYKHPDKKREMYYCKKGLKAGHIRTMNTLARKYKYMKPRNYEKEKKIRKKIVAIAEKGTNPYFKERSRPECDAYNDLAEFYVNRNDYKKDYKKAERWYDKSWKCLRNNDDYIRGAIILRNLASLYKDGGPGLEQDYPKYVKTLERAAKYNSISEYRQTNIEINLAKVYCTKGQYAKCKKYVLIANTHFGEGQELWDSYQLKNY